MSRKALFGDEARAALAVGVETLFRAVACTLGPRGRNVLMERHPLMPLTLTKDGVTVAKEVRDLPDVFENMGCTLLREAASKTSDLAGDGTTTSVVLAHAIFTEGLKHLSAGANPVGIKRGIDRAVAAIVERLKEIAIPVTTDEQIVQIGQISSNGDRTIGELVLAAMRKVGRDGIITLDDATGPDTYLEFSEGMKFDKGLIAQPMITDPERMECVLNNPYVVITERKIPNTTDELNAILDIATSQQRPVLFVAGDFDKPFVVFLIHNGQQGRLVTPAAVKAPAFGAQRTGMLEDMAVVTGGYAFTEDCGRKLDTIGIEDLGQADKITITRDTTTILAGRGNPDRISSRIDLLRTLTATEKDDLARERVRQRLARMASGIAVIKVGGQTEVEMKEKKDRVEDAVMATRAAVEEGILPGGGKALMMCDYMVGEMVAASADPDEANGMDIIHRAIESPIRQICQNAGYSEEQIGHALGAARGEYMVGLNVASGIFEDLILAGVIDPCKVTRVALQNAASVAAAMLTTECMVANVPS